QIVIRGRAGAATPAPATKGAEEAFAVRFATAYLTYDQAHPGQYRARLQPYLAPSLDPGALWDGQGTQQVLEALPVSTASVGNGVDRVKVAVLVEGGTWLYLGVPVHADRDAFVVVAAPALLPAPGSASWSSSNPPNQDPQLSTQLQGDLTAFFTAYGAGQQAQLGYYTTPGANLGGLGGEVDFVRLDQLVVDQGGAQRTATAEVTWQPSGQPGTSLQESYQLTLVQQGGKWLVSNVAPAGGS
ncbi:MAG: conjugal transfer protein, partial [Candidatus Dormibacteraeota bacterium]|nr:conjugal transfer protein [Candidatus Dormibacteraeota bacterium]